MGILFESEVNWPRVKTRALKRHGYGTRSSFRRLNSGATRPGIESFSVLWSQAYLLRVDYFLALVRLNVLHATFWASIIAAATPNVCPLFTIAGAAVIIDELFFHA